MSFDEIRLIDIFVCNLGPKHDDIQKALTDTKNYKYWTFITGITPNFINENCDDWAIHIASRIKRHVMLKFHYPKVSETDTGMITQLFYPDDDIY